MAFQSRRACWFGSTYKAIVRSIVGSRRDAVWRILLIPKSRIHEKGDNAPSMIYAWAHMCQASPAMRKLMSVWLWVPLVLLGAIPVITAGKSSSSPLVAQCSASGKEYGLALRIEAQIVLPERPDRILGLVTREGQLSGLLDNPAVGQGQILYVETSGARHDENRYLLIVTRMPGPGDPLQGFFLDDGFVYVVKAHLMESPKRFILFHGLNSEIYEGQCR